MIDIEIDLFTGIMNPGNQGKDVKKVMKLLNLNMPFNENLMLLIGENQMLIDVITFYVDGKVRNSSCWSFACTHA